MNHRRSLPQLHKTLKKIEKLHKNSQNGLKMTTDYQAIHQSHNQTGDDIWWSLWPLVSNPHISGFGPYEVKKKGKDYQQ